MQTVLQSWRTTMTGLIGAPLLYWAGIGFRLPANKQEAAFLVGSMVVLSLGLNGKDAGVSGPPPAPPTP